ncbi:MAG: pyruvate kinase [Candidatus Omnitrophota bacterium]
MPKAKIIATLGPASEKASILLAMIRAGMDVVRLNFSHGSFKEHLARLKLVRKLNQQCRKSIGILADFEGYRIRVGRLKAGRPITVKKHQVLWLVADDVLGEGDSVPFDYCGPLHMIKKGQHVYIDDGNIALMVIAGEKKRLKTKVIIPGLIKEHKGINIPDFRIPFVGLTEKDRAAIHFCVENRVEYIAQSFVRNQDDIIALQKELSLNRYKCRVIAKIENREGIHNIDEIIKVCDGIMIARGDMGISLPIYQVPLIQKDIIKKCNRAKKFVITATQMLESMTEHYIPTRAEVSDVANAILDGSDYLMLSAETAVGKYPVACVDMMNKIIIFTQKHS